MKTLRNTQVVLCILVLAFSGFACVSYFNWTHYSRIVVELKSRRSCPFGADKIYTVCVSNDAFPSTVFPQRDPDSLEHVRYKRFIEGVCCVYSALAAFVGTTAIAVLGELQLLKRKSGASTKSMYQPLLGEPAG